MQDLSIFSGVKYSQQRGDCIQSIGNVSSLPWPNGRYLVISLEKIEYNMCSLPGSPSMWGLREPRAHMLFLTWGQSIHRNFGAHTTRPLPRAPLPLPYPGLWQPSCKAWLPAGPTSPLWQWWLAGACGAPLSPRKEGMEKTDLSSHRCHRHVSSQEGKVDEGLTSRARDAPSP